ncbi:MAG TPA: YggS family pyridoxal phosphate-dependent enzyme [Opitutaceae bacterium]|nr:YggS family pyridoxal phosphate-dependent enzyme [Opitutaceae bacterium]HND61003.1 YggS family pyridoxal phosphate-dependent enzyme [Opitutaceae bacterium]
MFISYDEFRQRADGVMAEIRAACLAAGRDPGEVALLAVTKTHPAAAADYAARYGLVAVGENRVQEGVEKRAQTTAAVRWELIGHLQSNKARLAATHFDRIQSVDSVKLLNHLDRAAGELGKTLPVLLQINAGRDPAKFGAELEDAPALLQAALALPHLRVDGFMTIAPLSDDPAVAVTTFRNLRELRDRLAAETGRPLRELSMGMSGDFAAAIAAGSTQVRVGTALFGMRGLAASSA